ncbi:MAG: FmdB family zinc ribbon protein [Candidatus Methylomirabilia bacterium]
MPIYEYQCDTCGAQRELILKHGEVARPTCTACRKRMRRVISKTAFILKGSGWYVTDYPSDARKKGMEGEKPAAGAGTKKESTAAEGKPAAAGKKETAAAEKTPVVSEKKAVPASPGAGGKSAGKKRP